MEIREVAQPASNIASRHGGTLEEAGVDIFNKAGQRWPASRRSWIDNRSLSGISRQKAGQEWPAGIFLGFRIGERTKGTPLFQNGTGTRENGLVESRVRWDKYLWASGLQNILCWCARERYHQLRGEESVREGDDPGGAHWPFPIHYNEGQNVASHFAVPIGRPFARRRRCPKVRLRQTHAGSLCAPRLSAAAAIDGDD